MPALPPPHTQVSDWLDATLFKTEFRPVQLKQWLKVGRSLRDADDQVRRLSLMSGVC
jgi:replicative superfamily II helicase